MDGAVAGTAQKMGSAWHVGLPRGGLSIYRRARRLTNGIPVCGEMAKEQPPGAPDRNEFKWIPTKKT